MEVWPPRSYVASDTAYRLACVHLTYPDVEVEVLICDRLNVEPNGRYCCDYFADLLRQSASTPYAVLAVLDKQAVVTLHI